MVRRAKVPRDRNNRIMANGFSHRELYGWPDGISYSPNRRKVRKRKKRVRQETIDVATLPVFIPEALEIGVEL